MVGALLGAVLVPGKPDVPEVQHHIDAEHNVICYTHGPAMQCFTYVDQGTHLELMPKELAL